jgi:hypothetical protein
LSTPALLTSLKDVSVPPAGEELEGPVDAEPHPARASPAAAIRPITESRVRFMMVLREERCGSQLNRVAALFLRR